MKTYRNTIFFILISSLLVSCGTMGKFEQDLPKAHLKKIDIKSVSIKQITLNFLINITNPYPFTITLDAVRVSSYIDKNMIASIVTQKGERIIAKNSSTTTVMITLRYSSIGKIVEDYFTRDDIVTINKILFDVSVAPQDVPKDMKIQDTLTISVDAVKKLPALKSML